MAISRAIPREELQRCFRRGGVPCCVSDVCYVDPSEAMELMLAALALASAAFVACLAVTMSQ